MRKQQVFVGLMLWFLGTMVLLNNLGHPGVRGVDIVRFAAVGGCFGIGLVALMGKLKIEK